MEIPVLTQFDEAEFKEKFFGKKPVLYRNFVADWPAMKKWNIDYFNTEVPEIPVTAKTFVDNDVKVQICSMQEYVKTIKAFKAEHGEDTDKIGPYCHDIPIFLLAEKLTKDIKDFPAHILPEWYRAKWWRYVQFFMSAKGSVTPLHFDTLITHNVFFQIKGDKTFTILDYNERDLCSRRGWRWFNVDPEDPDLVSYPEYEKASPGVVEVKQGDMLYMPPGALHHVRSNTDCISFNIDFHSKESAVESIDSVKEGMPIQNIKYNYLCLKGLTLDHDADEIFEEYRPYLNYVS